jgi:hypothetical protein
MKQPHPRSGTKLSVTQIIYSHQFLQLKINMYVLSEEHKFQTQFMSTQKTQQKTQ